MRSTAVEKTTEEVQREIDELHRQQRERLRDPRGLRRGGLLGISPCNFAANGARQQGFLRPADMTDVEDQPPAKRRLSSAVVKCKYDVLSTKIEIRLAKTEPIQWASLEFNREVVVPQKVNVSSGKSFLGTKF
ncbi:hypothetical protein CRYUN_Cryun30bG0081000 [Craigia yunnanensis]